MRSSLIYAAMGILTPSQLPESRQPRRLSELSNRLKYPKER